MARLKFAEAKDPQADLIYQIGYAAWFGASDPVDPTACTLTASGCTLHDLTFTTEEATFWASGGTANTDAALTLTLGSVGGQVDQRTITLKIAER